MSGLAQAKKIAQYSKTNTHQYFDWIKCAACNFFFFSFCFAVLIFVVQIVNIVVFWSLREYEKESERESRRRMICNYGYIENIFVHNSIPKKEKNNNNENLFNLLCLQQEVYNRLDLMVYFNDSCELILTEKAF